MDLPLSHPPSLYHPNGIIIFLFFNQTGHWLQPKSTMKTVCFVFALMLGFAATSFAQQVQYSFDEMSYAPRATGVSLCLYSSGISNSNGQDKYYVTAWVDLQKKTITNPELREYGNPNKIVKLNKITHVAHLYLSTPNTGGVEAYACKGTGTNMVFYYLVGATTPDTVKFLFYLPSGPGGFQAAN